jgi:hypothetical protein
MYKKTLALVAATIGICSSVATVSAVEVPVVGNIAAKCVIVMDTAGVYGNPTPSKLSTDAVDGGVEPVVRFDVIQADYYKAVITSPNSFSSGPTLSDVVNWTGSVSVSRVSESSMSAYNTNKRTYDNVTEFDLTIAGSTWFKASSKAEYGFNKAFPSGTYRAIINADCIAL